MLLLDSWLHGAAQKKPITTWSPKSKCLKRKTVLVRKDLAQIVLVRKDLAQIQIHHDCVSMLVCFRFAILYEPYQHFIKAIIQCCFNHCRSSFAP